MEMTQQFFVFLSLMTVTFDFYLDIQTPPSDGPNITSLRIWRKSVQPFPRYLSDKQKKTKKNYHRQR